MDTSFNNYLEKKNQLNEGLVAYGGFDGTNLTVKAKIYEMCSKLSENGTFNSLIKDLFKLCKDQGCDIYTVNRCLEEISLRNLINMNEYENPHAPKKQAEYMAQPYSPKPLKKLK